MNRFRYILALLVPFALSAQQTKIDSLKTAIQSATTDSVKTGALLDLSWQLIITGNYEEAVASAKKALAISRPWPRAQAIGYYDIAYAYLWRGDLTTAAEYFERTYLIDNALNNKKGICRDLGSLGGVHLSEGNYPKALEYFLAGLKIAEQLKDPSVLARYESNLGTVYMYQMEHKKANEHFQKALSFFAKDDREVAAVTGNLGIVCENMGMHAKGISYFERALKMAEQSNDPSRIALWLENMGVAIESQGDSALAAGNAKFAYEDRYPRSLQNYTRALKVAEEIGDQTGVAANVGYIGALDLKLKKYKEAEPLLLRAVELADSTGAIDLAKDQFKNLSKLYQETGRAKLALEFYHKYVATKDSIANEENTRKIVQQEMQYAFDKKETATRLEQEKKDTIALASKRRQNIILIAVSGFGLLILGFAAFAWRSYRQKQRANEEITRQRDIIQEKQKEILDSIYYAKRIQTSLMSHPAYIEKSLNRLKN